MKRKPLWLKWVWCAIPAVIAILLYLILPHFPRVAEYGFTRAIFRVIGLPLEWLMSVFPFSVTEAVVISAAPALLLLLAVWIARIIKSPARGKTAERGVRFVAWCVSLAMLLYMVMHGANYDRLSAAELLALPDRVYTAEDLYSVTADLAQKASAAREKLPEDENGCAALTVTQEELLLLANDCYRPLQERYPFMITGVWQVKSVALSHLWSYTGFTGVYCPWLGESSINTDVPVYEFGHTATHEIAHTMGFAKENEANFLGWLACAESGQPDYVYSGHLQAYIYCGNALYKADKELWRQAASNCSEGVWRDLKNRNTYWKQFEGEVQESSQKFNDSFIKANGVASGTLSYNQMVELMLRWYDQQGFFGR